MATDDNLEVFELPTEPVMLPPSPPAASIGKSGVNMNGTVYKAHSGVSEGG
jgi:hypothetical protein